MEPLAVDADLPPSARHVAHVLQERGPCTQPEIVKITTLPQATVHDALTQLVEADLVDVTQRWADARGHRYELDG